MKAYKLVRCLKDGSFSPLFINKRLRIKLGVWLPAEDHKTKGYAHRPGWHCLLTPIAPHLSKTNRVWCEVEIKDFEIFIRPENQGGKWALAQQIKFIKQLK